MTNTSYRITTLRKKGEQKSHQILYLNKKNE